jgi:hypothetical protein
MECDLDPHNRRNTHNLFSINQESTPWFDGKRDLKSKAPLVGEARNSNRISYLGVDQREPQSIEDVETTMVVGIRLRSAQINDISPKYQTSTRYL